METICLSADHSSEEIRSAVSEAVKKTGGLCFCPMNAFSIECREFEGKYKMTSENFLNKFHSGDIGDDEAWFDGYAILKGKKI